MVKKTVSLFLALAISLCLGACSIFDVSEENAEPEITGDTNVGKPLEAGFAADEVFSLNCDPGSSFNPITSDNALNLILSPLIYEPLFELDETMTPAAVLCESYSTEDGKAFFFEIRTDKTFHDGTRLTAFDVSYSILQAMQDPKYRQRLSIISGISAISEETLAVNLKKANTQLPALLNIPIIKDGSGQNNTPPGTGSFLINLPGMRLDRFDSHENSQILPVDTIYLQNFTLPEDIINAYEDAVIDLVTNDPTGISNLGYGSVNETRDYLTSTMHFLGFNMERQNSYRQAITFAIDRSSIVTDIMKGRAAAATLPIWPLSPFYDKTYAAGRDFNMEKLQNCLNALEISDFDGDGVLEQMVTGIEAEFNIDFIVNNESMVKVAAARALTQALAEAGFPISLRELSYSDFTEALSLGYYDMYYGEVRLSADFNLTEMLSPGGSLNYGRIRGSEYSDLINEYLAANDDERKLKCDRMCEYIAQNAPIIPIVFEKQEVLTHAGAVTGLSPTQYNIFHNFTAWTIDLGNK